MTVMGAATPGDCAARKHADQSQSGTCDPPGVIGATSPAADATAVRRALSLLSSRERFALVQIYYRGRTTADAARLLGVAEATMRSYVYSALRSLRDMLR
jgi:RNA polymerase sigma-70 factor, ECF subfamily